MTDFDKDAFLEAYEDVRNDTTDSNWAVFTYEDNSIVVGGTGVEHSELVERFTDDDRLFAFLRVVTGDELSKRAKFVFLTWSGANVSPLKRAKMATDKRNVQNIIQNFAVELQPSELEELKEDFIRDAVMKAGGANYGTGSRE